MSDLLNWTLLDRIGHFLGFRYVLWLILSSRWREFGGEKASELQART